LLDRITAGAAFALHTGNSRRGMHAPDG